MIRGNKLKNPRARSGCVLCWNMGSASPAFAYVNVPYAPAFQKILVEVTLAICFTHAKARKEDDPGRSSGGSCEVSTGILDPHFGQWLNPFTREEKTGGGGIPIRDEMYRLVNDDITLITGIAGKVPGMNQVIRLNRDNDGTYEESLKTRYAKAQQARALAKVKRTEAMNARIALESQTRTIGKDDVK
jgi:hypothetical protein